MASPQVDIVSGSDVGAKDQIVVVFPDTDWQLWDDRPVVYMTRKQAKMLRAKLKRVLKDG
jgi:hypothetical protein